MKVRITKMFPLAVCCVSGLAIGISASLATAQEEEGAQRRGRGGLREGDRERGERGLAERGSAERGRFRGRGGPGGFGGPGGPGQAGPELLMRLPIIAALDTDHDGVISEIEIAGAAVALKKLDRNKDGKIDREEMLPRRGGRGPGGDAGAGDAAAMLNRMMDLDKNSDGFLSGSEIRERMKPMVERADENGDGKLSREEIKKAMGSRPAMMRRGGGGRPGGDRGADAPGGEKPRRPPAE